MPGMTGLELDQNLLRRGVHIPTIIITADGGEDTRDRCLATGAIAYFMKPLPIPSLLATVDAASGG